MGRISNYLLDNILSKILSEKSLMVLKAMRLCSHFKYAELFFRLKDFYDNRTHFQNGLLTIHNADHLKDQKFIDSYKLGKATGSWGKNEVEYVAYICCWAAYYASKLEGDFVECGVNKGGLSRTVINYIDFQITKKKFYLLDTFCGLSEKFITQEELKNGVEPGGYEECYDEVKKTFSEFNNVILIRGAVPDTLNKVHSEKIAYLSIDMNCTIPEIAALDFFWDKLVQGAVVILDDYGWNSRYIQRDAFNEFVNNKGSEILALPTQQGLIIKN